MGEKGEIDKSTLARWAYVKELATVNIEGGGNKRLLGHE